MLTLSVCIPSYNRFEILKETLERILRAKSMDFEVVIVDNCSPRNIDEFITFNDSRIRIIKRDVAISGPENCDEVIFFGNGIYSLLLLDKDRIYGEFLDEFIDSLTFRNLAGGYCELNSHGDKIEIFADNKVERFAFLCKHPSGNFYKTSLLKEYVEKRKTLLKNNPFTHDIYLTYCSTIGNMMYYDRPCVSSNLANFTQKDNDDGSLSYHGVEASFYYPLNRNRNYKVFVQCLNEMNLNRNTVISVLTNLYKSTFIADTIGYRKIMRNKALCNHYHHKAQNISVLQMLSFAQKFRSVFYDTMCVSVSKWDKFFIEVKVLLLFIKKAKFL